MKKLMTTVALVAAMGLTAVPAHALSDQQVCTDVADDAAYIMGVRQRGGSGGDVVDVINWQKYRLIGVDLDVTMVGMAWGVPRYPEGWQRQTAVRVFAEQMYSDCMREMRRARR